MDLLHYYIQEKDLCCTVGSDESDQIRKMITDAVNEAEFIPLKILVDCCSYSLFTNQEKPVLDIVRSDQICVIILREFILAVCRPMLKKMRENVLIHLAKQEQHMTNVWFINEFPLLLPPVIKGYFNYVISRYFNEQEPLGICVIVTLFLFRVVIPYIYLNETIQKSYRNFITKSVLNDQLICSSTRNEQQFALFSRKLLSGRNDHVQWSNLEVQRHFQLNRSDTVHSPRKLRKSSTFY